MYSNKSVIIVAGGQGLRMSSETPKQFIELSGQPILMHTIKKFHTYDQNIKIILVLPQTHFNYWKELCYKFHFNIPHQLIPGGKTRFESVSNGIEAIGKAEYTAIHDGVRPLVSLETISACFEAALKHLAAIPTIDCIDSLRRIENNNNYSVDRSNFKAVQTPQVFESNLLKEAYRQPQTDTFTDDATVIESYWNNHYPNHNHQIALVPGNTNNIKITTQKDLLIANLLLNQNI